jgi:hypothetical protein
MEYNIRTLKIKVYPSAYSLGPTKDAWKRLHDIAYYSRRVANECIGFHYWNDVTRRMVIAAKGDAKEYNNDFKDYFGVGNDGAGYRLIVSRFPLLPSSVAVRLSHSISSIYAKERKEVLLGNRSIRSYKKDMPIPISEPSISFKNTDKGIILSWKLSRKEEIVFSFVLGRDKGGTI